MNGLSSNSSTSQISSSIQIDNNSLQNIHQWDFRLANDFNKFKEADRLLQQGQQLPPLKENESDFSNKANFFEHLSTNPVDLYIYLRTNPGCINEQDENGETLVHHATRIAIIGTNQASLIYQLLFNESGINFAIKNQTGNTPVHLAAIGSSVRDVAGYIFPVYVQEAARHGFDFSIKGNKGLTVLHLAAIVKTSDFYLGERENLSKVLGILIQENISNLPEVLDTLSDSGSSALFYAINHGMYAAAHQLLDAGADPDKFGENAPERRPLTYLETAIAELESHSRKENGPSKEDKMIQTLTELREKLNPQ